eukprot:gnl/TRDRNA2_/TRDRNA2_129629_c0_seq1.p2 gnl/TRDRNA2_/TRDRNA2_129629_c0~~gnl/TRDRNA2_/TRDRNA2_129629_c0_seq1.p2  ORF type:complete len:155 (-),score=16.01 gnl/TRDRNA2_/TRDRNA2_129629_c0_seq1:10-474(-)
MCTYAKGNCNYSRGTPTAESRSEASELAKAQAPSVPTEPSLQNEAGAPPPDGRIDASCGQHPGAFPVPVVEPGCTHRDRHGTNELQSESRLAPATGANKWSARSDWCQCSDKELLVVSPLPLHPPSKSDSGHLPRDEMQTLLVEPCTSQSSLPQ